MRYLQTLLTKSHDPLSSPWSRAIFMEPSNFPVLNPRPKRFNERCKPSAAVCKCFLLPKAFVDVKMIASRVSDD